MNEYRREFLCEGVSFFYFKRIGTADIPNSTVGMSDEKYLWRCIPLLNGKWDVFNND